MRPYNPPVVLTSPLLRAIALQHEITELNGAIKRLLLGFTLAALLTSLPRLLSNDDETVTFIVGGNILLFGLLIGWYLYKRYTLARRYA